MRNVNDIRADFPMILNNPGLIYFDNGATTFKPQVVIDEVTKFYTHTTTNIHRGDYDVSFLVSNKYEEVRELVRQFINAKDAKEIVFTSGDTASLNMIAYSYGLSHLKKGDVVLTTEVEHASSVLPWFEVQKQTGCEIKFIKLNDDGTFNLQNYEEAIEKYNVKLVCTTYISNVLGYIYPVKEMIQIAHKKGALVNLDGAQAVPHIKVDVQDLNCDFLSFSGHKMCGPSGTGIIYGKYELLDNMNPVYFGGGSNARFDKDFSLILKEAPYKFESGTPNVEGVLGLGAAVKYLMEIGMDEIHKADKELVKYLLDKMSKLDNVTIYNPNTDTGIVSFNVKDIFAQDAATYLNKNKICVRSGNHCAKILHNIIHETETIRASLNFYNTKEEIDRFVEVLKETTLEKCIGAVI